VTTTRDRAELFLELLQRLLALELDDLTLAMRHAAQGLAEVLQVEKTDVFVPEPDRHEIVAIGTSDTPMGRLQHELGLHRLAIDDGGRTAQVFVTGQSYVSTDAENDPHELRRLVDELGVRSSMGAALTLDGELRGVVVASSAQIGRFDQDDLRFLETVAQWIGLVGRRAMTSAERPSEVAVALRSRVPVEMLTPRQREVAALIAQGLTNAEIAERLVLTIGTTANHVEQILTRLGFRNRSQIAVWASSHGLDRESS
jgi:two-component system OmpR family sensor kinase